MKKRPFTILIPLILLIAVMGCDNFSVLAQFEKSAKGLSLTAQKGTVNQGESVTLYPSGGTAPYIFEVIAEDLFFSAGSDFGYVTGTTFTAQNAVGKVRIRARDASDASTDYVITVLPLAPGSFAAVPGAPGSRNINLSWTYSNSPYVSGFRISFSLQSAPYVDITPSPISTDTGYVHQSLNQTKIYYYRMYAVAGNYESAPTVIQSAQPP